VPQNLPRGVQKRIAPAHKEAAFVREQDGDAFCGARQRDRIVQVEYGDERPHRRAHGDRGAMVTTASVDYERLENCVSFAVKRYRAGNRPALLKKASSALHDLEAMRKALGVENRKRRNGRKRGGATRAGETL
jgi:hypothetical protein